MVGAQGFGILLLGLLFGSPALCPTADNLVNCFIQCNCDVPARVMVTHLAQVTDVADVIANAILIDILKHLGLAGMLLGDLKRLPDGAGVIAAAAQVVHLRHPGRLQERLDKARHIVGMDVVAHLFALVAKHLVQPALKVALHQIAEEAMQLHAAVVGPGETAATQAAAGHAEITPVFLHHHIGRHLGGAEQRVLALVDREVFRDAIAVGRIGIVPARVELLEGNGIGPIAVHLVRGEVHERALRAALAGGFQQVERAYCVGVEVVERDGSSPVMAGLGGRVHDRVGLELRHHRQHPLAVADVELNVLVARAQLLL